MVLKSDGYSSDHIRLNRFVFWSSAVSIGILAYYLCCFQKKSVLADLCARAGKPLFGWYYMLVIVLCLGFVAWLAFSKVGQIPLEKTTTNLSLAIWLGPQCCFRQVLVSRYFIMVLLNLLTIF